jgi:WD40 repeat protein
VRFSPNIANPVIVSSGWDKVVKVCMASSLFRFITFFRDMMHFLYICYFREFWLYETTFSTKISDLIHVHIGLVLILTYY